VGNPIDDQKRDAEAVIANGDEISGENPDEGGQRPASGRRMAPPGHEDEDDSDDDADDGGQIDEDVPVKLRKKCLNHGDIIQFRSEPKFTAPSLDEIDALSIVNTSLY
jgi:hypothetical protein